MAHSDKVQTHARGQAKETPSTGAYLLLCYYERIKKEEDCPSFFIRYKYTRYIGGDRSHIVARFIARFFAI
jgi:hypothetical protein